MTFATGGPGDSADARAAAAREQRTAMRPVVVDQCFGWLHSRDAATGSDVAILICPGVDRDRLDAHQSLRVLADELAAAGYAAMRLDYPATGDSGDVAVGEPLPGGIWAQWQQSIHAAVDWLRAATGARRVILCGVRIGATLATMVAEQRDDVGALVLLAPVLRGRSYIQQLRMEARQQRHTDPQIGDSLHFHDVHFSADAVALVSATDLRQAALAPGLAVAVFAQAPSRLVDDCVSAWSARGASVFSAGFDGLDPMLRHNQEAEGAPADFSAVLGWLRATVPPRPARLASAALAEARLAQAGWVETPQRFGAADRLVGILCRPAGRAGDLAVIIANTGRDPHYGFARFGVEFARRLARAGVASLRFDFAGVGDSIGPSGKEDFASAWMESDRTADVTAAVDLLAALGHRRIAAHGLCAGAYHTLRGALADRRIGTLLLLNLPMFEWRSGDTYDVAVRRTMTFGDYAAKLRSKAGWARLMRGSLDVGGIMRVQSDRAFARARAFAHGLMERLGWTAPRSVARRSMATLAQRGTRMLFLYCPEDDGIKLMEQEFGRAAAGLGTFAGSVVRIVPEWDHLLSTVAMRQAAMEMMLEFLADPPQAAGEPPVLGLHAASLPK